MSGDSGTTSAMAIAGAIRAGKTTAVAVAESTLANIARIDPQINSFTAITRERALKEAAEVDRRRSAGQSLPPLAGVPYAVKNLFDVVGLPTLAGSKINRDLPPAIRDATLISHMHDAGAVLVGVLNMDEYAYGFTTENTHYGPTRNPHDVNRISGGSSGGSAAAVAARMVPLSLGSDTNGSIRVPSSLNGIWGLKPTYGRLSRAGSFPFVASLDHLGPMAATLDDLAACYDALQGPDERDPASAQRPAEPVVKALADGTRGLRVARLGGYFDENVTDAARDAVDRACAALAVTRKVIFPDVAKARAAAFIITASEGAALHLPDLRARADDFDPLTRDRFLAGALVPAAWYLKAQRLRAWFRLRVLEIFGDVDVLITAATPSAATPIGTEMLELAGQQMPLRASMGMLTQPISCIGLPVVVAPVPPAAGLPVGVQLIAAPWREDLCFRVAHALVAAGAARSPIPEVHV
jgi:AtzE family amidohydrolase